MRRRDSSCQAAIIAFQRACLARPGWPEARAKLATVAVLAIMLDAFFLRAMTHAGWAPAITAA